MALISDILMIAGSFGAALYCYILSRRLLRLQTLEGGMGGAIAVLSAQVDDMTRALREARVAADTQTAALEAQIGRADAVAARLELMMAALNDLPEPDAERAEDAPRRVLRRRPHRSMMEAAE